MKRLYISLLASLLLLSAVAGAVSFYVPVTVYVRLPGDVNWDCRVNVLDLALVGLAYGSRPGDGNWNPQADLKRDGRINILDLVLVGLNFGKRC